MINYPPRNILYQPAMCIDYSRFDVKIGVAGEIVGLAITQAMSLSSMVQWGMRMEVEVENQMVSVERVLEYSRLPSESVTESDSGINSLIFYSFLLVS